MTSVRAQVSADGTLSTTVTSPNNLNFTINNGDRVGGNLFHSFREFSVPNNGSAVFQNALDVQNIISRVTGGSLSQINGLIQAQGTANLFLLNPAGIFFGQNARLNIGGSFFATTADSLLFGDGIEFSATNPQAAPLLTVNIPIGLRFRDSPGNITNRSVVEDNTGFPVGLQVNPGNSLALVGGNVSLEQGGRLTAAGGRIELGGLAGAGTVGLQTTGNTFTLNFPANGLSNVSLLDDARVAVRSNGGGEIVVNANIFTATNGGRLVGGIEGIATRNGGDIIVNSNEFNISGVGLQSEFEAGIAQQVVDGASGNAGNIVVNTKSFNASSGAQLQNRVLSTGTGNAGNISITSNSLSLTNAFIDSSTSGNGNAGNISLQVGDAIAFTDSSIVTANVQPGASGRSGNIDIQGRSLTVTDGSQIQAGLFRQDSDLPGSIGTGGSIKINTSDFVDISGFSFSNGRSGIFTPAETGSNGPGGSIDITTGAFRLANFAIVIAGTANGNNGGDITINAKTFEATNGLVETTLSGQAEAGRLVSAGNIQLNVSDSVSLKDGSVINSSTSGQGNAGNISLQVGDAIALTNGSVINSSTFGQGNAGNISLQVGDAIALTNDSVINSSTSGIGNAGNISLQVGDAIALTDSSTITTNVQQGGSGIGGDIDIRGRSLTLTGGSQIQAGLFAETNGVPGGNGTGGSIKINASDFVDISGFNPVSRLRSGIFTPAETGSTGPGGSINITTGAFRLTNFGIVTARNDNGNNGGDITINAKTFEATNGLVQTSLSGQAETDGLFKAGDIQLNVTDSVTLKDSSRLISSSFGEGNAGNVTISADGAVSLENVSRIFSTIESTGKGNGGQVNIQAGSLSLKDGSTVGVSTFGQGNAGSVIIKVQNTFSADGVGTDGFSSGIFSSVAENGIGNAGGIDISTGTLSLFNGAVINASTFNRGNAGTVKIQASDISLDGVGTDGFSSGIFSTVQGDAVGNAGGIDITTGTLSLFNGAIINASTFATGDAGTVKIQASDSIFASGVGSNEVISSIQSNVQQNAIGNAGGIDISTKNLSFANGAEITAITFGRGNAGTVKIQASDISLDGVGSTGFSSGIFSTVQGDAVGNAGGIDISTGTLSLFNGAIINASTFATGDAGTVKIQASDSIFASGVGSNTVISSIRSNVQDNAIGNAGGIDISTKNLFFTNGAQIIANTLSNGNAGNVTISASDRVSFTGVNSGIFANTASGSTGNGGNITIQQEQNRFSTIAISDGAEVTVDSQGQGQGGEISITGNSLTLDRGIINASTASGDGGNINLNLRNFIRLRNESLISASAGGNGNGGNITINSPFIVAFPQNNDIIANAVGGSGGRVTINRSAILFGIAPLRRADLLRLLGDGNLDPRRLPTSDITAFSEQNSNFGDNVQVTSPDVDPSRGLVELPETVTDTTQQVAENPCRQGFGNEFIVTGRGGLPTSPNETLSSDNVRVDLLQPVASSGNSPSANIKPATTVTARRIPAQGWIFNDKGQVVLIAYDPTNTGSQRPFSTAACPAR
ncbi:filamentous hemagglutinin N-terminal domain-containing protein [Scytonema hofmannii]|nr:filamentous hemagglutinin N-terminal domain-containing protein [Scytonema hofmannii]